MTKLLFILFVFCTTTIAAQPGRQDHKRGDHSERTRAEQRTERFARIKAARQAFITEELELTPKQATAFFPVYWDYEQRMVNGKKTPSHRERTMHATKDLTEKEARAELLQRRTRRQQMLALSLEAEEKYLQLIPATKVIRLPDVERAFRRKLWDRTRRHKEN